MRIFPAPLLVLFVLAVIAHQAIAQGFNDPSALIAACGKPDIDDSTEYDKPRPPLVTRWLSYKRAGVTAVYLADVQLGTPPPYKTWKLVGVNDDRSKKAIALSEFISRVGCRTKK
jgi:hypothetical protein